MDEHFEVVKVFGDDAVSVRAIGLGLGVCCPFCRWKRYEQSYGTPPFFTI